MLFRLAHCQTFVLKLICMSLNLIKHNIVIIYLHTYSLGSEKVWLSCCKQNIQIYTKDQPKLLNSSDTNFSFKGSTKKLQGSRVTIRKLIKYDLKI